MAFCKACGTQLEGTEKFCVKCGAPVAANGAATPVGVAAPVATGVAGPPVVPVAAPQHVVAAGPGFAPSPGFAPTPGYAPPGFAAPQGGVPVMMPPPPAAKKSGMFWIVALIALAVGGWWYYKHHPATTASTPSQPGTGPSQSGPQGSAPSGTNPGSAPANAPSGTPVQPGDAGPSETNANLVAQQGFGGDWRTYGGYIQVYNVRWQNRSTVPLDSAVLECDQYAVTSEVLSQIRTKLNGPVLPGGTATYNPFLMGAEQQYVKTVNCAIVAVTPTS